VEQLAASGADVAFSYRREKDAAAKVAAEVSGLGRRVQAIAADLSNADAPAMLYRECLGGLGVPDLLVCNAGVASRGLAAAATSDVEYERLWRVHFMSNVALTREAVPAMREAGSGALVYVSSTYSVLRPAGAAPYAAAKSALEAFAEVLAKEERAYGIRVNTVAPGLVATDMGDRLVRAGGEHFRASDIDDQAPFGRVCRPSDVADVVLFALSGSSSYLTGQRLVVDGGGWPGLNAPTI